VIEKPTQWAAARMFTAEMVICLAWLIMPRKHPYDLIWRRHITMATLEIDAWCKAMRRAAQEK
jgi:hypothetical protein